MIFQILPLDFSHLRKKMFSLESSFGRNPYRAKNASIGKSRYSISYFSISIGSISTSQSPTFYLWKTTTSTSFNFFLFPGIPDSVREPKNFHIDMFIHKNSHSFNTTYFTHAKVSINSCVTGRFFKNSSISGNRNESETKPPQTSTLENSVAFFFPFSTQFFLRSSIFLNNLTDFSDICSNVTTVLKSVTYDFLVAFRYFFEFSTRRNLVKICFYHIMNFICGPTVVRFVFPRKKLEYRAFLRNSNIFVSFKCFVLAYTSSIRFYCKESCHDNSNLSELRFCCVDEVVR